MDRHDEYYTQLFRHDPAYSTPYPNLEESRRWAVLGEYLSRIAAAPQCHAAERRLLDVGCGRGWLTRQAQVFGECEGIDLVPEVIGFARELFPGLTFHLGTVEDLRRAADFAPYDAILCSEVLEHVEDKPAFAAALHDLLAPGGHLCLTTPRGEAFAAYARSGYDVQPVERWLTEVELRGLFERGGFRVRARTRIYDDLPRMSRLHRSLAEGRLAALARRGRFGPVIAALRHVAAAYQAWWFEKVPAAGSETPTG